MDQKNECEECHELYSQNELMTTTCCSKLKCGIKCASPCDPKECDSWLCDYLGDMKKENCFGRCLKCKTEFMSQENYKSLFLSKEDHDQQLALALSKFSNNLNLNLIEQLLVNEELNIAKIYPQIPNMKNPF